MQKTTPDNFINHINQLGVKPGMNLVIHSNILAFGYFMNASSIIYDVLRKMTGSNSTLVVPTYTFDTHNKPYDPKTTPSSQVGVFSEYVRQQPDATRSLSPIHSHAAIGLRKEIILESPPTVSLGKGTDFEILHREDFYLLLLGCSFSKGCTYLHHLEALSEVPYRAWITLDRILVDPEDNTLRMIQVPYFARQQKKWKNNFDIIIPTLQKYEVLKYAKTVFGSSYLIALHDLHTIAMDLLFSDPYALVKSE